MNCLLIDESCINVVEKYENKGEIRIEIQSDCKVIVDFLFHQVLNPIEIIPSTEKNYFTDEKVANEYVLERENGCYFTDEQLGRVANEYVLERENGCYFTDEQLGRVSVSEKPILPTNNSAV